MTATARQVLRGKEAAVEPFYPPSRLMRGVQFDAEMHANRLRSESDELRAAAERELAAAHIEATAIVAQARAEAKAIRAAAAAEGQAAARAEVAGVLAALAAQIGRQRQHYAERLADAAFLLAKTVLAVELTLQPTALRRLVAELLRGARDKQVVEIHVAPAAVPTVTAARDEFAASLPACQGLRVVADSGLAPDAVQVCTERGCYGASVRGELARLRRAMRGRVAALLAAEDEMP
ncbi:MAG: hypothetical protein IPK26_02105 [Planctomycetes bacterium]|nr:hypothetical protein [Planctomycetota bacterium]